MRTHLQALGWLHILLGALDLLLALLTFGAFAGIAVFAGLAQAGLLAPLAGTLGVVAGSLVALTALPNLAAGWGLLKRRPWARVLAIILGIFNAFKFPWGTALAAYTLWVLTREEVEAAFQR